MKIALFDDYRPGIVVGNRIADASEAAGDIMLLPPLLRMPALIESFDELGPAFQELESSSGVALSSVRLRAPIPRPSKILCAGRKLPGGDGCTAAPLDHVPQVPADDL